MTEPSNVVAVTGASGYIGARLLQELEEENLDKLVAIDTKPLPFPIHNIAAYRHDVETSIGDILSQWRVSTLVHLAFDGRRGSNRREQGDIRQGNVRALNAVLESCVRAGVPHVIYVSSHTVYGARPNNPVPLTERANVSPVRSLPLGFSKTLSEQALDLFRQRHEEIKVTVLRPCAVLGPGADEDLSRVFLHPGLLEVWGYNPAFQFLHEDDLARVITVVIRQGLAGVFNVAGEGVAFYHEVEAILQRRMLRLPLFLAGPLAELTWQLGLQNGATRSELDLLRFPTLLSTAKLEAATGYHPHYTSLEALTAFANTVLI
jgi:UDP-glucose 4-epimerase